MGSVAYPVDVLVPYGALFVLLYSRMTHDSKETSRPRPWYMLEPFAIQIVTSLPAALALSHLIRFNYGFISWWKVFQNTTSPMSMMKRTYYAQLLVYFGFGGWLFLAQAFPSFFPFMQNLKLQKDTKVEFSKIPKLMVVLACNTLLPLLGIVIQNLSSKSNYLRFENVGNELISSDSFLFMMIYEVLFHTSHRILHFPIFYKYIHKLHHEWNAPVSIAAAYAHPVENLVSNVLPAFAFLYIRKPHIVSLNLFVAQGLAQTLIEHCGFELIPGNYHDLHHEKFKNNYGSIGILDKIFGTFR